MSFEGYPSSSDGILDLINQCEIAIEQDDPINDSDIYDLYDLPCARICEQIRQEFETKYQLFSSVDSVYKEVDEFHSLYEYSRIILNNPSLYLRSVLPNEESLVINVNSGAVELSYLGIALERSVTGKKDETYTGPHFFGVFNTFNANIVNIHNVLEPGDYKFLIPLKNVEVSDEHIPHLMN